MIELLNKLREFAKLSFPNDSLEAELGELHAELVQLDSVINGAITTYLAGIPVDFRVLEPELTHLREQIRGCEPKYPGNLEMSKYKEYSDELEKLLNAAVTAADQNR